MEGTEQSPNRTESKAHDITSTGIMISYNRPNFQCALPPFQSPGYNRCDGSCRIDPSDNSTHPHSPSVKGNINDISPYLWQAKRVVKVIGCKLCKIGKSILTNKLYVLVLSTGKFSVAEDLIFMLEAGISEEASQMMSHIRSLTALCSLH